MRLSFNRCLRQGSLADDVDIFASEPHPGLLVDGGEPLMPLRFTRRVAAGAIPAVGSGTGSSAGSADVAGPIAVRSTRWSRSYGVVVPSD